MLLRVQVWRYCLLQFWNGDDHVRADNFIETILDAGHRSLVEFKLTDVEDESEVDGI